MSYTNVWTTNRPIGSQPAKLADDEIRALRLDIQERMNNIVADWTTDPIVVQGNFGGPSTGNITYVHHSAFQNDDGNALTRTSQYTLDTNTPTELYAPLMIVNPLRTKITQIALLADARGSGGTITGRLASMTFDTNATVGTLITCTVTGSGVTLGTSPVSAIQLGSTAVYFLWITTPVSSPATNPRIYGMKITYDIV